MPIPHLDSQYSEVEQPSTNGDAAREEVFKTYIKNRFARLRNLTQPRAAMEKARKDFAVRREQERALENEEVLT